MSASSHSRTGNACAADRDAAMALVISSATSSSAFSLSRASPHSRSTCRVCSRAHGTAPGSGPSSRVSWSGHGPGTTGPRPARAVLAEAGVVRAPVLLTGDRALVRGAGLVASVSPQRRWVVPPGTILAVPTVQAAAKNLGEMATFDSAGVTDKDVPGG